MCDGQLSVGSRSSSIILKFGGVLLYFCFTVRLTYALRLEVTKAVLVHLRERVLTLVWGVKATHEINSKRLPPQTSHFRVAIKTT
jgi:hypothetical protein